MSTITYLIKKNDLNIFYLLNRKLNCKALSVLMSNITQIGSTIFSIIITLILLFAGTIYRTIFNTGLLLAISLILSQIIIQLTKRIVNRQRPYKTLGWVKAINPPKCKYSFPSGHTCAAFTLAFSLSYVFPAYMLLFMFVASMVAVSRIYLGCHYPTDVFIGFLVALITNLAAVHWILPFFI